MATITDSLVDSKRGLVVRKAHVDPDVYRQEQEQIFGRCWLYVAHETQIGKPNDFMANYMGEDPILATRDAKAKVHTFLNMCRHRGNRICRADAGNAPSFMCTYHGWTFATDGKLVGVPGYKEAYFEELDRNQWGLVEARTETYKGLVFANWDLKAPSLLDYLGDYTYWMDVTLDRTEGGTEARGGVWRFAAPANWKFGSDNFGGDNYHTYITHGAGRFLNRAAGGVVDNGFNDDPARVNVSTRHGHQANNAWIGANVNTRLQTMRPAEMKQYYQDTYAESEKRLGAERAKQITIGPATTFPNMSWANNMVRVWHPRGPMRTEVWHWCIVDKVMPEKLKAMTVTNLVQAFGPSGNTEQDDGNNFVACTEIGRSPLGARQVVNQPAGLGHEFSIETAPGILSPRIGEGNQRSFYNRWQEMMSAPSWDRISIEPRKYS